MSERSFVRENLQCGHTSDGGPLKTGILEGTQYKENKIVLRNEQNCKDFLNSTRLPADRALPGDGDW
jgi:hypothetical protein